MKKVDVVFGGQFGSEAKRLFLEYYVHKFKPETIVTNYGPNSGGFVSDGSKWSVFPFDAPVKTLMLSPGSVIDPDHFREEATRLTNGQRIMVHPNAAIVSKDHIEYEKDLVTIGSTMTGTAASVFQKIRRDPDNTCTAKTHLPEFTCTHEEWLNELIGTTSILLSVPQGHSLSINHGFYPYCTSRNCSPQQGLADAGIPVQWVDRIIGCYRTFPIRVANRYDDSGKQIGWSGPCYEDQQEITWKDVGVPPEYTSVSKKVRRVFTFSDMQFKESIIMNGVTDVFLSFINYLPLEQQMELVRGMDNLVSWVGYGPTISEILPTHAYNWDQTWIKK